MHSTHSECFTIVVSFKKMRIEKLRISVTELYHLPQTIALKTAFPSILLTVVNTPL